MSMIQHTSNDGYRELEAKDSPEECLLCTQNLHCAGWLLGEVDEAARVCDEARTHQLTHQHRQVGGNGSHAALQVVKQLAAVL